MSQAPETIRKTRHGGWLPHDETVLAAFRASLEAEVVANPGRPLVRPVRELYDAIMDEPLYRMHLTEAIDQALAQGYHLYYKDIEGLMHRINAVMHYAPPFSTSELVGCPLNALLDWPMCMPSGFAFFQFPAINEKLRHVLNYWGHFLSGPNSRHYLTTQSPKGWFGAEAEQYVNMSQFVCDPALPHWGFSSWNDFFTRRFKTGERPVAGLGDAAIVTAACESTPYAVERQVKLEDRFWIKAQPYSLRDMFSAARTDLAEHFVGGTVYQAFLSAYNYHRWHAPVSGTVCDAYVVGGTYYADAPSEGLDPAGPNNSQGFITAVATRAMIVIDTGSDGLGKVACLFVGMAEISSCVIEARVGRRVEKGEEIGFFQYGGSTHCLMFERDLEIAFGPKPPYNSSETPVVKLNSHLATVVPLP